MSAQHDDEGALCTYRLREGGPPRARPLHLYPEPEYASVIIELLGDLTPTEAVHEWVRIVERRYPEQWERDAIRIHWFVGGGELEGAPFQPRDAMDEDFLTHFTWPMRDGERLDWFTLPVHYSRIPELGQVLGFKPSPFQSTLRLRTWASQRRDMPW